MQKNSKKIAKKIFYGRSPVLEKSHRYTPAAPFRNTLKINHLRV